jgi:hypothetical protein
MTSATTSCSPASTTSLASSVGQQQPKPYQARYGQGKDGRAAGTPEWRGPRRATAAEAALDYCQYVNSNQATPATPALKSAGHKRTTVRQPLSEGIQRLRQQLRDAIAAEREAQGSQGFVYLIGEEAPAGAPRYVKIGYSDYPDARIAMLQTGNPRKLTLLASIPGTMDDERALHAKHIADNILAEWFRDTPSIRQDFQT